MKTSILICLAAAISVQAQNFTDFPCTVDSKRVAVIGGGAAAVAAAETAQANGWQAIIVDPRNHVAGMMAASNHSWLLNGSTGESVQRPEGTVKKELFARVMDSGAYPLLLSHCAGLLVMGNRVKGVAIASKFGTFIMEADAVIDASEEQIAAKHLLGLPQKWTQTAEINFELSNAHAFTTNKLSLPDGAVTTHRTIKDGVLCISAHKSVECAQPFRRTAHHHGRTRTSCNGRTSAHSRATAIGSHHDRLAKTRKQRRQTHGEIPPKHPPKTNGRNARPAFVRQGAPLFAVRP